MDYIRSFYKSHGVMLLDCYSIDFDFQDSGIEFNRV